MKSSKISRYSNSRKMAPFGRRLVEAFGGKPLTEIAHSLGVKNSTITGYIQGRIPSAEVLLMVASRTGVTVDWLLTGGDAARPKAIASYPMLLRMGENEWVFPDPPKAIAVAYNQAVSYADANMPDEAQALYRSIATLFPFVPAWNNLGVLLSETGDYDGAFDAWKNAIQFGLSYFPEEFIWGAHHMEWYYTDNRAFLQACLNLALELRRRGQIEEAVWRMKRVLQLNPSDNQGVRSLLDETCEPDQDRSDWLIEETPEQVLAAGDELHPRWQKKIDRDLDYLPEPEKKKLPSPRKTRKSGEKSEK